MCECVNRSILFLKMDLDKINCPQFVNFNSASFMDSLTNNDSSSSENKLESLEGDITSSDIENSSVVTSEEEFVLHVRTTRSQALKKKEEGTIPQPFHFETDNRLKTKDSVAPVKEEKDFVSQLRQHEAPHSTACGVTKVKAFNLTESKNKKMKGTYVPLAEQIIKFNKTPDRYRSTANKEFQPQEHWSPLKVRPKAPELRTTKRHRVVHALSQKEREEKELEEMRAYEFHARPVDPRVYHPDVIEKKETKSTKPVGFNLKTSKRAAEEQSTIESQTSYEFHARPVPKNMFRGPSGLGEKPPVKVTKASSPAFCTRKRLEKRKLEEEEKHEEFIAKKGKKEKEIEIQPPKKQDKKTKKEKFVRPVPTIVKPFSFDQVDMQRYSLKEKKIQEEIEKENKPFVFKAQLLPSPTASKLPSVEKKPATRPKPFNFVLDTRNLSHEVHEKNESVHESFTFKAQPATVLQKEPFIPEKTKHTIVVEEFELNTERRASERLELLKQKEAAEQEKEQIRLARKALEEEQERQEIIKLRQELVHKANPVRQFKTVEIKHSSKPLTQPKTPRFKTDKRVRNK